MWAAGSCQRSQHLAGGRYNPLSTLAFLVSAMRHSTPLQPWQALHATEICVAMVLLLMMRPDSMQIAHYNVI